jgi:hypothetical protein
VYAGNAPDVDHKQTPKSKPEIHEFARDAVPWQGAWEKICRKYPEVDPESEGKLLSYEEACEYIDKYVFEKSLEMCKELGLPESYAYEQEELNRCPDTILVWCLVFRV